MCRYHVHVTTTVTLSLVTCVGWLGEAGVRRAELEVNDGLSLV